MLRSCKPGHYDDGHDDDYVDKYDGDDDDYVDDDDGDDEHKYYE